MSSESAAVRSTRIAMRPAAGALRRWGRRMIAAGLLLSAERVAGAQASPQGSSLDVKQQCVSAHRDAQVHRRSGKLRKARDSVLLCAQESCPVIVRADCLEWAGGISQSVPSVALVAKVDGRDELNVRVLVDGDVIATRLDGRTIELDPGVHSFRFEFPPLSPVEFQVLLPEGEKNKVVSASFESRSSAAPAPEPAESKPAQPPPADYRPIPLPVYLLGGAGLVMGGLSAYYGVQALELRNSALDAGGCRPFCGRDQVDAVKRAARTSDVFLALGIGAITAAGVVFLTRPAKPAPADNVPKATLSRRTGASFDFAPIDEGGLLTVQGAF
jgi:hypothetical protein